MRERLTRHPWIAPLKPSARRAARVTTPGRFFVREALRRDVTANYSLRHAPTVPVVLRHHTRDLETFDQIFCQGAVAPPTAVAARLRQIGRPLRVLDLGANIGASAAWFGGEFSGATITCIEPDPANLEVLARAAALATPPWTVVAAAASTAEGELAFRFTNDSVSRASEDESGTSVRAVDALGLAIREQSDLVKIDIEGGEWALLADPRLADLPAVAIALEYHPHLSPAGRSPRDTAVGSLEHAGYHVHEVAHVEGAPAEDGSLWALRPPA